MSLMMTVPVGVPSVFQSSLPWMPSSAWKRSCCPAGVLGGSAGAGEALGSEAEVDEQATRNKIGTVAARMPELIERSIARARTKQPSLSDTTIFHLGQRDR